MQNPREQDYSENEMLAFLKIYRPPREGFENFYEFNSHYLDCDVYELNVFYFLNSDCEKCSPVQNQIMDLETEGWQK